MKKSILKSHGINSKVLSNGAIIAIEENPVTGDMTYTNVTNMSVKALYEWLGY